MSKPTRAQLERRRAGDRDGYRIGPDGVDPNGEPAGYDPALFGDADYLRGASEGRARRIDEQLAARGGAATGWIREGEQQ